MLGCVIPGHRLIKGTAKPGAGGGAVTKASHLVPGTPPAVKRRGRIWLQTNCLHIPQTPGGSQKRSASSFNVAGQETSGVGVLLIWEPRTRCEPGNDSTVSFQVICLIGPADGFGDIGRAAAAATVLRQKVRQSEGLALLVLLLSCWGEKERRTGLSDARERPGCGRVGKEERSGQPMGAMETRHEQARHRRLSQFIVYFQRDNSLKFSRAEIQSSHHLKHTHTSRFGGQPKPQTSPGAVCFGGGGGRGRSHPTSTQAASKRCGRARHGDPTGAGIPPEPEASRPRRHLNESPARGFFSAPPELQVARECLFVEASPSPDEAGRRDGLRHLPAAPGTPGYF